MTDDLGRELRERLGRATLPAAPSSLRDEIQTLRTSAAPVPTQRRFGRGRGMTLLAAAAVVLVGGALAAGSGVFWQRTVAPPAPSFRQLAIASSDTTSASPSDLARPSASPIRAAGPGSWVATGSMITPRFGNIAVRLADGRVLVAGGEATAGKLLTSAELYDPSTGTWSATGSMLRPGSGFAILLPDGRVLVQDDTPPDPGPDGPDVIGAELFDPATGTWTAIGKPSSVWNVDTATLLRDGTVLMVAGNSPRIFDPASETWTATPKMVATVHGPSGFYGAAAVLLPDGRVLAAGGDWPCDRCPIKSAELYDPQANSWTATTDLPEPACCMMATLLQDGTVLVVRSAQTVLLYDPAAETWTRTGAMARQDTHYNTITPLLDGTVLAAYGGGGDGPMVAEVYDPSTRSWSTTGSMLSDPWGDQLSGQPVLLSDGTVLVAGGGICSPNSPVSCPSGATGFAERYVPPGVSLPTSLAPVPNPTPTPTPTPEPTPFPPMAGPVPHGARPWKVTVENKSSKPATLFLAEPPFNDVSDLCGSVTPDVVPAGVTEKVTFQMPPKGQTECWLMILPVPGADGAFGPTDGWPIPGPRKLVIGAPGENGPDSATLWEGP